MHEGSAACPICGTPTHIGCECGGGNKPTEYEPTFNYPEERMAYDILTDKSKFNELKTKLENGEPVTTDEMDGLVTLEAVRRSGTGENSIYSIDEDRLGEPAKQRLQHMRERIVVSDAEAAELGQLARNARDKR